MKTHLLIVVALAWGVVLSWGAPDDDEELQMAVRAEKEAVNLLSESMKLAMEAFTAEEESVSAVVLTQRLLIDAQKPETLPADVQLKVLKEHHDQARSIHTLTNRRHQAGAISRRELLLTRANKLLREAAYNRALSGANAQAVEAMQKSIKANALKEFKFDQVIVWRGNGVEEVEGELFQVGVLV